MRTPFWSLQVVCTLVMFLMPLRSSSQVLKERTLREMQQDLQKTESSIRLTKEKIRNPQDVQYLPDMYFMLAEFQVTQARLMYAIKRERFAKTPINELDFTNERRPKLEAIETYKTIEDRFPQYKSLDKVYFFMAHEFRELNDEDNALKSYKKLIEKFPQSTYWDESQVAVGNIFFQKKDFDFALEQFGEILKRPVGPMTALAHYKRGWCYINKSDWLKAMDSFVQVFDAQAAGSSSGEGSTVAADLKRSDVSSDARSDVREEALVASVQPFSELKPEELRNRPQYLKPISFYRSLAFDKSSFRKVLSRLAKRLAIKDRNAESAEAYFELMRLSDEARDRREALESFYEKFKKAKLSNFPQQASSEVRETIRLTEEENHLNPKKAVGIERYEVVLRDIATSLHLQGMKTKRIEDLQQAVLSYDDYLSAFANSKYRGVILINKAEALFHMNRFVESGEMYERISQSLAKNHRRKREMLSSSVQSYIEGLKDVEKVSLLEKVQGRAGLRAVGEELIKDFPRDQAVVSIRFNIAKSFYDEGRFDRAINLLRAFLKMYPTSSQAEQTALLLLDCFYQQEKLKELVAEAQTLRRDPTLPSKVKMSVETVMQQAQMKKVKSLAGDFNSKSYADKFLQFAKNNKGSPLGETALYEAYLSLRANNDLKAFDVGETFLTQYSRSQTAKPVLVSMVEMALIMADFRRAANYYEAFSQSYHDDPAAQEYQIQALNLYELMGDVSDAANIALQMKDIDRAAQNYLKGGQWKDLVKIGATLSGLKGLYYQGLGLYRQGAKSEGLGLLMRATQASPADVNEKVMAAHAGYLVALESFAGFSVIGRASQITPQLIQQKVESLQKLDQALQVITALGVGRWTIASLYLSGRANTEMAQFFKNGTPPTGLSKDQFLKVVGPRIAEFEKAASVHYSNCLQSAEQYEVFTRFVDGCRSLGKIEVSESQEVRVVLKAQSRDTVEVQNIRKQLSKDPRSIALLNSLANEYVKNQDFAAAFAVFGRMQNIEPRNSSFKSSQGILMIYMNNLEAAQENFQVAIKINDHDRGALWGLAALSKKFEFQKNFAKFFTLAKSQGPLEGITHPWIKSL